MGLDHETRKAEEYKAAGWAGMMSLPRVLSMGSDERLRVSVAAEVNQLRTRKQSLNVTADEDETRRRIADLRIENCLGEILCTVRRPSEAFVLVLCGSAERATPWLTLSYDPLHPGQVSIDDRPVPVVLADGENIELHLYVDSSVIEVFVNRQAAWTKRFYYHGGSPHDLRMRWNGKTANIESLNVWQISPISADRLTTAEPDQS